MKKTTTSLAARLTAGYLLVAAITLLVAGVGYYGLNRAAKRTEDMVQRTEQRGRFLSQAVDLARTAQVEFKKQVQAFKDILLRGQDPIAFAKHSNEFAQQETLTLQTLASLKSLLVREGADVSFVDESVHSLGEVSAKYREALKSYDPSKPDAAQIVDRLVKGIDRPATEAIATMVNQARQLDAAAAGQSRAEFLAETATVKKISLAGGLAGVVCAMIAGICLSRSISAKIRSAVSDLSRGSEHLAAAARQVAAASQAQADGSSEQAASLEETSASLEEMSSMTRRNSDSAQAAKAFIENTRAAAERGSADLKAMAQAAAEIKAASDNIAKIIQTIDEIAFQTNILALNAAVEAARAGSAGLGFAVVADEVRTLAQRCAAAAHETTARIMESIGKSQRGVEISGKVTEGLSEVVDQVHKTGDLIAEIAAATQEQSLGISQVNSAVTQIDKVTQSNAASAEEGASAAEELSSQSQALQQIILKLAVLVDGQMPSETRIQVGDSQTVQGANRRPLRETRRDLGSPQVDLVEF